MTDENTTIDELRRLLSVDTGETDQDEWINLIKLFENKAREEERKECEKAVLFFKHLENHNEVKQSPIYPGIPMCRICGKNADEIFYEAKKKNTNESSMIDSYISHCDIKEWWHCKHCGHEWHSEPGNCPQCGADFEKDVETKDYFRGISYG